MFAGLARQRAQSRVVPVANAGSVISIRSDDPDFIVFEAINLTFTGATAWLPNNAPIGKQFTFVLTPHPQINPALTTERITIKAPLNRGGASFVQTATLVTGQAIRFIYTQNGWVIPAGGVSNFADARNTTSPNGTVPVISLTPVGSETDIDVAILPKGNGAVSAQVANNTTVGGNKRGANAVDWQMTRAGAANVASSTNSTIGGGASNQASGTSHNTVAGGNNNQATTGSYNSIGGGNGNTSSGGSSTVGGGLTNTASGAASTVAGGETNQATGNEAAIGGGKSNTAAFGSTVAGGELNNGSGSYATIGGGLRNVADGLYSCIPGGKYGSARGLTAVHVFSSGNFSGTTAGQCQAGKYVLRRETTNATPSVLTTDNASPDTTNIPVLPNNSTYAFNGTIVGRGTASGDSSAWTVQGVIKRGANAASTALVGAVIQTLIAQDVGAVTWVLALTADTTNGGLAVTVTGVAATTIRWVATLDTAEVTN